MELRRPRNSRRSVVLRGTDHQGEASLEELLAERNAERIAEKVAEKVAASEVPTRWLTVEDAATHVSHDVSLIYRLIRSGTISSYRPTRKILVSQEELDQWVRRNGYKEQI